MAHLITISMTPAQFEKAQIALDGSTDHVGDEHSGTVHSKQIDFDYTWDGSTLTMDIIARHGLEAKIASDDQIKAHIEAMLGAI